METTMIPLHGMDGMHGMYLAPFPLMTGLFVGLLFLFLLRRLFRHGRLGPVRFDGGRRGPWRDTAPAASPEDAALATLKQRLATGDISVEEYLERSSVLAPTHRTDV